MIARLLKILLLLVLIFVVPLQFFSFYLSKPVVHEDKIVILDKGESLRGISRKLSENKVIKFPALFVIYGRLTNIDRKIKAGEYVFRSGLSPKEIYKMLEKGEFRTFNITIIEGWNNQQIADYLAKQEFAWPTFAEEFLLATKDPERIAKLGIKASSLEGFLFPNTYFLQRPKTAGTVVDILVQQFLARYSEEIKQAATNRGMSLLEVVTLASIVEKETGAANERRLVSAVFHNRLKLGMKLETDPTVVYGIKDYDGIIHRSDLNNPHPYNTYIHAGLPPGPIANPGLEAIKATVDPANVDYLYFVSKNDGTHIFSKAYSDHSAAVQKYQR